MKNYKSTKGKKRSVKANVRIRTKVRAALTVVKGFHAKHRVELALVLSFMVLTNFAELLLDSVFFRCIFTCIIGVATVGVDTIVSVVTKGLSRLLFKTKQAK